MCHETGAMEASEALTKHAQSIAKLRSHIDAGLGVHAVQEVSKCMVSIHSTLAKKKHSREESDEDEDDVEMMDTEDEEASASVARGARERLQGSLPPHDMPPDMALLRASMLRPGKRASDCAAALKELECSEVQNFRCGTILCGASS